MYINEDHTEEWLVLILLKPVLLVTMYSLTGIQTIMQSLVSPLMTPYTGLIYRFLVACTILLKHS